MQEKWEAHKNEWRTSKGSWLRIISLPDAFEIADRADKRIAELELRIALLQNETA